MINTVYLNLLITAWLKTIFKYNLSIRATVDHQHCQVPTAAAVKAVHIANSDTVGKLKKCHWKQ